MILIHEGLEFRVWGLTCQTGLFNFMDYVQKKEGSLFLPCYGFLFWTVWTVLFLDCFGLIHPRKQAQERRCQ